MPFQAEPAAPHAADVDAHFACTYRELRQLARARLAGSARDVLLDTTALVHECYLRLNARQDEVAFPDRAHFLAYAGRAMRSVIVDLVRQRRSERHGGDLARITLTGDVLEQEAGMATGEAQILLVHEALQAMAQTDPRMAQVVEMRYFAGLTDMEIAGALGVTDRTVRRDWAHARLFLAEALR